MQSLENETNQAPGQARARHNAHILPQSIIYKKRDSYIKYPSANIIHTCMVGVVIVCDDVVGSRNVCVCV